MAHYRTRIRTGMTIEEAFAYLADLRNFQEWDPGITGSRQVVGKGPAVGAAYDVTADTGKRTTTLRYEVTRYDPPRYLRVVGENSRFLSIDVVEAEPTDEGSVVTYDATLKLKGFLGIGDVFLRPLFKRIGERAAAGLEKALDGTLVGS